MTSTNKALPTKPHALYERIKKGQMPALEALLQNPKVDWNTPISGSVYPVLHGICNCPDSAARQLLLERFAQDHPPGHPVWTEQASHALEANLEVVHFFSAHGSDWTRATEGEFGLVPFLVHQQHDFARAQPLLEFLLDQSPAHRDDTTLHLVWNNAVVIAHPDWMRWCLEQGVDPKERLRTESGNGYVPTHSVLHVWRNSDDLTYIHDALEVLWQYGARFEDDYQGHIGTFWDRLGSEGLYGHTETKAEIVRRWETEWKALDLAKAMNEVDAPRVRRPRL